MNKLLPLLSFLFLVFVSCEKPKRDTIEIYLTKERIPNKDGIPFLEYLKLRNWDLSEIDTSLERSKYTTFDSLNKRTIYLGNFHFKKNDLQEQPFITNEEILGFDEENMKIIFAENIIEKFPELPHKSQFVLTINKKPVMNGYFEYIYSSASVYDTFVLYFDKEGYSAKKNHLRIAQGTVEGNYIKTPDFKTINPAFYNAFQKRNKENNLFQD